MRDLLERVLGVDIAAIGISIASLKAIAYGVREIIVLTAEGTLVILPVAGSGGIVVGATGLYVGLSMAIGSGGDLLNLISETTQGVSNAELPGRNGALNQAKGDAGILRNSKPDYVESVPMREPEYAGGHVIKDADGNIIYTREYHYTNSSGEHVIIQEHSAPHIGSDGPHFNVRPITDTRHGVFPGTQEHYLFKK